MATETKSSIGGLSALMSKLGNTSNVAVAKNVVAGKIRSGKRLYDVPSYKREEFDELIQFLPGIISGGDSNFFDGQGNYAHQKFCRQSLNPNITMETTSGITLDGKELTVRELLESLVGFAASQVPALEIKCKILNESENRKRTCKLISVPEKGNGDDLMFAVLSINTTQADTVSVTSAPQRSNNVSNLVSQM